MTVTKHLPQLPNPDEQTLIMSLLATGTFRRTTSLEKLIVFHLFINTSLLYGNEFSITVFIKITPFRVHTTEASA
jgi:hypothetical protein